MQSSKASGVRLVINWGFMAKVVRLFLQPPALSPGIQAPEKEATSHLNGLQSSKASGVRLVTSSWSKYLRKSFRDIHHSPSASKLIPRCSFSSSGIYLHSGDPSDQAPFHSTSLPQGFLTLTRGISPDTLGVSILAL